MTEPGHIAPDAQEETDSGRNMRVSGLWVKIAAGFVLIAVAAVGLVAVLANRATTREFQFYVSQGRMARAERLAPEFADYYALHGSWDGVQTFMDDLLETVGTGRGQGRGLGSDTSSSRLLLVNTEGQVIADSAGELMGEVLPSETLATGVPIEADSEQVGTLLATAQEDVHQSLETQFVREVNRALWWAGLAAAALALAMGLLLARQLTAPLRVLTQAARRLAQGRLETEPAGAVPQVHVGSHDEIGELGLAFNQMARSLARQETLRRNLMADIAHELRTPLSVIRSDIEALLDGVYQPTPQSLASLHDEALMLARLVDDLRSLAEAEAGQLRLVRKPVDLGPLLSGVLDSFSAVAEAQGQEMEMDLPPDLPLVEADAQRVRQIVANLVSNALKHAPDCGRVLVQVAPSGADASSQLQVSVADDGPGIPAEELEHLFDRFWRGQSTRAGGSGLGLAISRELVRAHGGRIWAESAPGRGAIFRFTLPLAGVLQNGEEGSCA
jgi:signal transduction histidine kinase